METNFYVDHAHVYTVKEVALILKSSTKTVYNMIRTGELEAIWIRSQIRITSKELERFLEGG